MGDGEKCRENETGGEGMRERCKEGKSVRGKRKCEWRKRCQKMKVAIEKMGKKRE